MKCNKEKIKNVKQSPCVDAAFGISKENHNAFWSIKREEHKKIKNSQQTNEDYTILE